MNSEGSESEADDIPEIGSMSVPIRNRPQLKLLLRHARGASHHQHATTGVALGEDLRGNRREEECGRHQVQLALCEARHGDAPSRSGNLG